MTDDRAAATGSYATLLYEDPSDLYENAPCGYLSTDPYGIILKVNQTFLTQTGHQRHELLGTRRFLDLLTPGGRILYETHLRPLLRMQGFVREIALDVMCTDGRQLPVIVSALERRAASGIEAVIRMTVFDATDRRRYERELLLARRRAEQAAQARSDLIAMVSHDVRAPLSALLTAAAMLEKTETTPQQARYVRIIKSAATNALTLLNSILDLSSLEAGHAVLRDKEFDVRELVHHVAGGAKLAAAQKPHLEICVTVDPQTPQRVKADREKIGQVLMNLAGNAVKFTDRGQVSLSVYPRSLSADLVTLEFLVSDTGIGIAPDRLPHIFDEFTQASAEIGEKYGGTGLGLSISRKVLRLFGSDLHVTSTPGQGTTFSFVLQLRRADGQIES